MNIQTFTCDSKLMYSGALHINECERIKLTEMSSFMSCDFPQKGLKIALFRSTFCDPETAFGVLSIKNNKCYNSTRMSWNDNDYSKICINPEKGIGKSLGLLIAVFSCFFIISVIGVLYLCINKERESQDISLNEIIMLDTPTNNLKKS